jgi:hypothetical protein
MESLDKQKAEYRDIQAWLAGKKPPARGRTWRRRIRQQLLPSAVVQPLEQFGSRMPPVGLPQIVVWFVLLLVASIPLEHVFMPPPGTDLLSLDQLFLTLSGILRPIARAICLVALCAKALFYCFQGD